MPLTRHREDWSHGQRNSNPVIYFYSTDTIPILRSSSPRVSHHALNYFRGQVCAALRCYWISCNAFLLIRISLRCFVRLFVLPSRQNLTRVLWFGVTRRKLDVSLRPWARRSLPFSLLYIFLCASFLMSWQWAGWCSQMIINYLFIKESSVFVNENYTLKTLEDSD